MTPTDQTVKWRIIYLAAVFSLVGFLLEIGPVSNVFPLAVTGLRLEGIVLGFLAYFALAASAAIGLHLGEEEPTPKKEETPQAPLPAPGQAESVGESVRVRPELHQLRMLFTALVGYTVLKGISLALMWPSAQQNGLVIEDLIRLFRFGLLYTGLAWLVLLQFMRWYAQQKKWVRLQDELVGIDASRTVAVVILVFLAIYFVRAFIRGGLTAGPLGIIALLLHLTVLAAAVILWTARPHRQKSALTALLVIAGLITLLTLTLIIIEYAEFSGV